jgi:hypothetical protein
MEMSWPILVLSAYQADFSDISEIVDIQTGYYVSCRLHYVASKCHCLVSLNYAHLVSDSRPTRRIKAHPVTRTVALPQPCPLGAHARDIIVLSSVDGSI